MTSAKRRAGEPPRARFARPAAGRRAALYLRVSTCSQTTDNQRLELITIAERCGWAIVAVYEDTGVSGAKGRDKRPQFDALCRDATRRRFDVVMAWSVDRLGRSLQDLVAFLGDLHGCGVDLYLHQQGIDTTTPSGKAMFQMLGVFAEFERAMIRERVHAGLSRARQQGKRLGRPQTAGRTEAAILADLQAGTIGIRKIAAKHGVGVSVVQRIKAGSQEVSEGQ
ncbi:DNA invertase Pin-like site-specific DNA recombinase [Azospirillum fermentarium]|uniref:recombinase family protein n=1 Tax=Azospirillum fermentarium TaxID=1233114 RepID=UPI0022260895|nr:recombinase family protein [Azospirillum fermentarium]MCW2244988.1 DNA invertase Pin-like site-specific DNA recombinase [Azospirillum fermentarium]